MRFNKKQCRYTSLLVTLCIILSCLVSYTSTISTPFIDQAASVHSEEAIYNLSITSSGEDICTPEMLGRQELISRPEISHKIRTFQTPTSRCCIWQTYLIRYISLCIKVFLNIFQSLVSRGQQPLSSIIYI